MKSRLARPDNPFLLIHGLDQKIVSELADEYQRQHDATKIADYAFRVQFMRNLHPFVVPAFSQTPEDATHVKTTVRHMMERRFPVSMLSLSRALQASEK